MYDVHVYNCHVQNEMEKYSATTCGSLFEKSMMSGIGWLHQHLTCMLYTTYAVVMNEYPFRQDHCNKAPHPSVCMENQWVVHQLKLKFSTSSLSSKFFIFHYILKYHFFKDPNSYLKFYLLIALKSQLYISSYFLIQRSYAHQKETLSKLTQVNTIPNKI